MPVQALHICTRHIKLGLPLMAAIGIDFGEHTIRVAAFSGGRIIICEAPGGSRSFPNVLSFAEGDAEEVLVGERARAQAPRNSAGTIFGGGKRLLGAATPLPEAMEVAAAAVGPGAPVACVPSYSLGGGTAGRLVGAEDAAARVLAHAKALAEAALGRPVTSAVISMPTWFSRGADFALRAAAGAAGLRVLRTVSDGALAAVAHAFASRDAGEKNVIVYDIGGGSLKVVLSTIEDGIVEIKSVAAEERVSGNALDARLASHCARLRGDGALPLDARGARRLRAACEAAKCELSGAATAVLEVERLDGAADFRAVLTRADMEAACQEEFSHLLVPVERVLNDARMAPAEVHLVLLLGGTGRVPRVEAALRHFFGGRDVFRGAHMDTCEAVAMGAAIQAAILTTGRDDPPLPYPLNELLLLDVTPYSLGFEAADGSFEPLIRRNSTIPAKRSQLLSAAEDGQPGVDVRVFAGERARAKDNTFLGVLRVDFGAHSDGVFTLSFDVDANQRLRVHVEAIGTADKPELHAELAGGPRCLDGGPRVGRGISPLEGLQFYLAMMPRAGLDARLLSCTDCWFASPRRECPRVGAAGGSGGGGGGEGSGHDAPHQCPVCFEGTVADMHWASLQCGHLAHSRCLMKWAAHKTHEARTAPFPPHDEVVVQCPLCRAQATRRVGKNEPIDGEELVRTPRSP